MMTPFRITVEHMAIYIPFRPQSIENSAVSGILRAFIGSPTTAGGRESPAPENAPLRITSAAEKIKTDAETVGRILFNNCQLSIDNCQFYLMYKFNLERVYL